MQRDPNVDLDRQSYKDWLNPIDIGEDTHNIHHIITKRLHYIDRDILLARFYERLSYREIAVRFEFNNKGSSFFAVKRALKALRRELQKGTT